MSNYGGKREGAGRKLLYQEETKVVRVPKSRIEEIKSYLKKPKSSDIISFEITSATSFLQIPIADELLSAGFPSPAQDYVEKSVDMNQLLIQNETATFIGKVGSRSMLNAGLDIDDKVVVDRSLTAKHEDIVVALIDNDFTIKRLMIEADGTTWLKAENPEYHDIHFKDNQELIIWGVITFILKATRK